MDVDEDSQNLDLHVAPLDISEWEFKEDFCSCAISTNILFAGPYVQNGIKFTKLWPFGVAADMYILMLV